MVRKTISLGLLAALSAAVAPAEAWTRSGSVSVQGAGGRGFVASRAISRQPGSVSASRSIQANDGRGIASTRTANWGDGTYSGGASHTLANGDSFGRSTSVTRTGDGTASYATTRTGPNGQSSTISGTVSHLPQ